MAIKLFASVIPAVLTILLLALLYLVPFHLSIFNWVSPLLVFYIQYLLSMLTPSIYLFGLALQISFRSTLDETSITLAYMVAYSVMAFFFQRATMKLSVGAIRFISPDWDLEQPGEYLWPAIVYWLGIKEHTGPLSAKKNFKEGVQVEPT